MKGNKNMKIEEKVMDLFTVSQGYYLAHCISGDFALGAGVAVEFDKNYNMKAKLNKRYPLDGKFGYVGHALLIDNVFNLVTKARCFHKPTYNDLYEALTDMHNQMEVLDITKVAMPLIGCGLDRLEWDRVKDIIEDVFEETDIEILICKL